MRKEEKQEIVQALTEQIKEYGNFYITDTSELTVAKINTIRRKCLRKRYHNCRLLKTLLFVRHWKLQVLILRN